MRSAFSGTVSVSRGQVYVQAEGTVLDVVPHWFTGQSNGLCGAAAPGCLFLVTGLHTGRVRFAVQVHDAKPPIDEAWEEIVEASFVPRNARTSLVECGGPAHPLDLAVLPYRVRYCASGMDAAQAPPPRPSGSPGPDSYLLQLWPGAEAPDRVVKQTSAFAARWHDSVGRRPDPVAGARRRDGPRVVAPTRPSSAPRPRDGDGTPRELGRGLGRG